MNVVSWARHLPSGGPGLGLWELFWYYFFGNFFLFYFLFSVSETPHVQMLDLYICLRNIIVPPLPPFLIHFSFCRTYLTLFSNTSIDFFILF